MLKVVSPKVANQSDPIGIDEAGLRFSWQCQSDSPAMLQSAYQIRVASSIQRLSENPDLWDSQIQRTSDCSGIHYAGKELASSTKYFWSVRVWDQEQNASDWSSAGSFVTGIVGMQGWHHPWITMDRGDEQPMPMFRFPFPTSKPVEAYLHICGLGHYEASVNGQRVGDREFDTGWTWYPKTCLYSSYDVTSLINEGENVIGVILGKGMYSVVRPHRYVKFRGSFGPLKFRCQLSVRLADGTTRVFGTSENWKSSLSPIVFSCIYGGEDYDARLEQPGWDKPGFDDSKWSAAKACDGPGGELMAQLAPPVKVARYDKAISVKREKDGKLHADVGLNLSGRPVIKLKGKPGQAVTIEVGEIAGKPWKNHSYTYTLKSDREETFRPKFSSFGFQHLFVSGAQLEDESGEHPVLLEIGRDYLTSSAADVATFECSNSLLNEMHAAIDRSIRSNMWSILSDCPHREKLGWQEEIHLMAPSILYHYDVAELYRKIFRDQTDGQYEDGRVSGVCPDYVNWGRDRNRWVMSAEWGSASVQAPWFAYEWTGEQSILREQFETMYRYTKFLSTTRDYRGLCQGHLGDWYDWRPVEHGSGHNGKMMTHWSWDNYPTLTPLELTATAMLYDNARVVAKSAELLGKSNVVAEMKSLREKVQHDFQNAYFDKAKQTIATNSQAASATALYFDLVPADSRAAVLQNLISDIEKMNYRPTAGEVCWPFVIRTLTDAGRSDIVYKMVNRTDKPGYGYMLSLGFKTLSETWDGPGESMNHFMFGHIQEWFIQCILGIDQQKESFGFSRIKLKPMIVGDLTSASGHFDSPRGRISSKWSIKEGLFDWQFSVPANSTAEIFVPTIEAGSVRNFGQIVGNNQKIHHDREEKIGTERSYSVYRAGSGEYHITSRI